MPRLDGYFGTEKEIDSKVEEKLRKIAKNIVRATNEISKLGYTSYLSSGGSWNIVDGDTHSGANARPNYDCVVANFKVNNVEAGDF